MKTTETRPLQILGAVSQFIIPIYQRTYPWTRKECEQFWAEILQADNDIGVHFVTSVAHIDSGQYNIARHSPKQLRLSLNMPFADLDDPKGLAKNVTGIGRWSNGDVEIGVATLEEVPYATGLIRQSLEHQLDDTAEAP